MAFNITVRFDFRRLVPAQVRARFRNPLLTDFLLYALSAAFAVLTGLSSSLPAHRPWGRIAAVGYAVAALVVAAQALAGRGRSPVGREQALADQEQALFDRGQGGQGAGKRSPGTRRGGQPAGSLPGTRPSARAAGTRPAGTAPGTRLTSTILTGANLTSTAARAWLTGITWVATALAPLVYEAVARSGGRTDRAQEEVLVVEAAGQRMLDTGSPYLSRSAIAALHTGDQLLGYTPYQPGMAIFGLPRAATSAGLWITDARVLFALVTAVTVGAAAVLARRWGADGPAVLRAVQAVAVVPICTLTAATGGDDLPVLGLCLLGLTLAARQHWFGAGIAVGIAGSMKVFALPVAAVLVVLAAVCAARRVRATGAVLGTALAVPALALVPAWLVDPDAAVENVVRFPTGNGLVRTPAQSPLLGYLITQAVPGGRLVALGLLGVAALGIAGWLLRYPPRDAGAACAVCAVGLTVAIVLAPATRFGYLLYPLAYACAVPMLRRVPAELLRPAGDRTPVPPAGHPVT